MYISEIFIKKVVQNKYIIEKFSDYEEQPQQRSKSVKHYIMFSTFLSLMVILLSTLISRLSVMTRKRDDHFTEKIRNIVKDSDVNVYVLPSKKEPNAFNLGTRSLYYTPMLKKMLTDKEMIATLLHEYGHFKGKHVWKLQATKSVIGISTSVLIGMVIPEKLKYYGVFAHLYILLVSIGLIGRTMGQSYEIQADSFASKLGYKKELGSALQKLEKHFRFKVCESLDKSECGTKMEKLADWDPDPLIKDRIKKISDIAVGLINKGEPESKGILHKIMSWFRK